MTDRELLIEYVSEGSERAFAEIVERHIGRVLATCGRVLGDRQEAEDAAQATFLLLVKKARGLSRKTILSGWLYQAARNVALNARKRRARRAEHEREASEMHATTENENPERLWTEVRPELDVALAALSGHQRNVVVLRYFYGKDQKETAEELGCSRESVALAATRGLAKLRDRLARRGVAVPAAALGALLLENCTASVPAGLTGLVTAACLGKAAASASSLALAQLTAKTMALGKVKLAAAVLCALTATGAGGGFAVNRLLAAENGTAAAIRKAPRNRWVKLDASGGERLSSYSAPVYVPSRRTLLQWNTGATVLRRFDAGAARWVSDKPDASGGSPATMIAAVVKAKGFNSRGAGLLRKPGYQAVMGNAVWDSRRKRVVYTMNRFMAAYDPATKKWEDIKARSLISGREYPGGPPVFGAGACYDPVNDEIVMFPHFTYHSRDNRHSPKNYDRLDVDGRISNHLGTLRFSFKDRTWRRVADTFGSPEVKRARKELFAIMKAVSGASDGAYGLRRGKGPAKPDEVAAALGTAASDLGKLNVPAVAKADVARAAKELEAAAAAAKKKNWGETVAAAGRCLWVLNENVIDGELRVEPPPRCATAMVYHPEKKCIVMFGGRDGLVRNDLHGPGGGPGALDDTWIYDCTTRQWRELACPGGPPVQHRARLFYDPATKKVFLVNFIYNWKTRKPPFDAGVWSLDIDAAKWSQRLALKWNSQLYIRDDRHEVGFDPERSLLVSTHFGGRRGRGSQEVYFMRLDLAAAPAKPAPARKAQPPLKRQAIPADDPAWVAKLKTLPANQWVLAKPPTKEGGRRDWGNVACDPVRGHVYYFGGGHSTYQVNDVAIYVVGANTWSFATGDHNDFLPPTHWGGCAMGFRGGKWAHHQRNSYAAVDGRMYVDAGPLAWFYDLDRGGVWRKQKASKVALDENALAGGPAHMTAPGGQVIGLFGRIRTSCTKPRIRDRALVSVYDCHTRELTVKTQTGPSPGYSGEQRPFCYLPDRKQIFFYEHAGSKEKLHRQHTWVYDVKTNRWIDLKPRKDPFKGPGGTVLAEYIEGQDAVWCVLVNRNMKKRTEYWVYSFKRNAWTCMAEKGAGIGGPYGQAAYVAKYGVLVAVPKRTRVMRVDVEKLKWE